MPTATLKRAKAIGISPAVRSWTASIHTPKPMRMAVRRNRALTDRVSSVFLIVSNPSTTSSNTAGIAEPRPLQSGVLSLQLAQAPAPWAPCLRAWRHERPGGSWCPKHVSFLAVCHNLRSCATACGQGRGMTGGRLTNPVVAHSVTDHGTWRRSGGHWVAWGAPPITRSKGLPPGAYRRLMRTGAAGSQPLSPFTSRVPSSLGD
jgi:hypothetical protein